MNLAVRCFCQMLGKKVYLLRILIKTSHSITLMRRGEQSLDQRPVDCNKSTEIPPEFNEPVFLMLYCQGASSTHLMHIIKPGTQDEQEEA